MHRDCIKASYCIMAGSVDYAMTSQDDEEDNAPPVEGTVPVGITIAYQRQQKGFTGDEKMLRNTTTSTTPPPSSKKKKKLSRPSSKKSPKKAEEQKAKSSSFQVFLESATIYTLCLALPTMLGYLYSWYDTWKYEQQIMGAELKEETYYTWFKSSVYDSIDKYVCDQTASEDYSYAWSLVSSMVTKSGLCPTLAVEEPEKHSVLSDDVSAGNDFVTIAVCSFLLAVVRIAIVQYTVPMDDSDTLEAMVRVKSDHFLRSNYLPTPSGTPQQKKIIQQIPKTAPSGLMLPALNSPAAGGGHNHEDDDDMFGVRIDASEREEDNLLLQPFAPKSKASSHQNLLGENPIKSMSSEEDVTLLDATAMLGALPPMPTAKPLSGNNSRNRLYAAPRYATAIFRLLYTTATVAIALIYFRAADFWPWYVLGHGHTAKCWDLSGGMSVGMDSDFDQVRPLQERLVSMVRRKSFNSSLVLDYRYTAQRGFEAILPVASQLPLAFRRLSHSEFAHFAASSDQACSSTLSEFPEQLDCLSSLFSTAHGVGGIDCRGICVFELATAGCYWNVRFRRKQLVFAPAPSMYQRS